MKTGQYNQKFWLEIFRNLSVPIFIVVNAENINLWTKGLLWCPIPTWPWSVTLEKSFDLYASTSFFLKWENSPCPSLPHRNVVRRKEGMMCIKEKEIGDIKVSFRPKICTSAITPLFRMDDIRNGKHGLFLYCLHLYLYHKVLLDDLNCLEWHHQGTSHCSYLQIWTCLVFYSEDTFFCFGILAHTNTDKKKFILVISIGSWDFILGNNDGEEE